MEADNLISKEKVEKYKLKSSDILNNIKADYFLKKVFNYFEKKRTFNIIKYNKNIKNRIDINIKDYKEYSEKFSSIEIEIKPVDNKYGQFINIKKNDQRYYHIYFNNKEKEIKRNYIKEDEEIKIIKIIIEYQITSLEYLFSGCSCIESIYFKKFSRNNINNMNHMFSTCSSLKELNLNNFNTNNVTDMGWMFSDCLLLKELNLNNFNTNNVTKMNSMFSECSSLKELNLNNFNTNNVIKMNSIFSGCSSLIKLNINNFNTNNVTDMRYMFYKCSLLKQLNLDNFNINNAIYMDRMFYGCSALKELNLDNFNINNTIYIEGMFYGCSNELIMKIKTPYKNIKEIAFEK